MFNETFYLLVLDTQFLNSLLITCDVGGDVPFYSLGRDSGYPTKTSQLLRDSTGM